MVEICQLYLGFYKMGGLGDGYRPGMTVRIGGMLPPKWPKWEKVGSPWGLMKVGQTMNHQPTLVTSPQMMIHSLWENLREDALCQSGEA